MSKAARTKGHSFERFIAKALRTMGFEKAGRQLEYQANQANGIDIADAGPFRIQCKKLKKYVSINTIKEVKLKSADEVPLLITAGDNQEPMVVMPLWAFMWLGSKKRVFTLHTDFEDGIEDAQKEFKELRK